MVIKGVSLEINLKSTNQFKTRICVHMVKKYLIDFGKELGETERFLKIGIPSTTIS